MFPLWKRRRETVDPVSVYETRPGQSRVCRETWIPITTFPWHQSNSKSSDDTNRTLKSAYRLVQDPLTTSPSWNWDTRWRREPRVTKWKDTYDTQRTIWRSFKEKTNSMDDERWFLELTLCWSDTTKPLTYSTEYISRIGTWTVPMIYHLDSFFFLEHCLLSVWDSWLIYTFFLCFLLTFSIVVQAFGRKA